MFWKTRHSAWIEKISSYMVLCTVLVILVYKDGWACALYMAWNLLSWQSSTEKCSKSNRTSQPGFLGSCLVSALPTFLPAKGLRPSSPSHCSVWSACPSPPLSVLLCICWTIPGSSAVVGIFPWSLVTVWSKSSVVRWPVWCCLSCGEAGRKWAPELRAAVS